MAIMSNRQVRFLPEIPRWRKSSTRLCAWLRWAFSRKLLRVYVNALPAVKLIYRCPIAAFGIYLNSRIIYRRCIEMIKYPLFAVVRHDNKLNISRIWDLCTTVFLQYTSWAKRCQRYVPTPPRRLTFDVSGMAQAKVLQAHAKVTDLLWRSSGMSVI